MSSSHPIRLALVALASMLASEMSSATSDDVPRAPEKLVFRGIPIEAQEESVKCDIKHISGVSLRRLVDCDSATYITIPKKTDLSVIRFEIRPENPEINQGRRAELRDMLDAVTGEEVWYRFSTLVPRDFPKGAPQVVVAQWHEQLAQGEPSRRPPLAHRLVDGVFIVTLWNDEIYDRSGGKGHGIILFQDPAYTFGSVYEYVYRIVWSPVGQGNVTGWRREKACLFADPACKPGHWHRFISYRGPIGYEVAKGYYFKLGIYTVRPFESPLIVYHRAYQRGPNPYAVRATEKIFRSPY
jgi:hypothetical protein